MAGGIDWFRWHHGSVTDPKFSLVARNSGASLPDVIAVWAYILELASASQDRGYFGKIDAESLDCYFNFPATEKRTADIIRALEERGLIGDSRVIAWEKRQPKREREDDSAAERKAAQRERERLSKQNKIDENVTPPDAEKSNVTPCHAMSHQKKPRGEERREELSTSTTREPPVDNFLGEDDSGGGEIFSSEPFAMFEAWKPSEKISVNLFAAGVPKKTPQDFAITIFEFVSYWQTRPDLMTQAQWEHKFVQNLIGQHRNPKGNSHAKNHGDYSESAIDRQKRVADEWLKSQGISAENAGFCDKSIGDCVDGEFLETHERDDGRDLVQAVR